MLCRDSGLILDKEKMGKNYESLFHWLGSLFLKLHGTPFVPATLEVSADSVASSWLCL